MKRPVKTAHRVLFGFVAALDVFGWVQGALLVGGGDFPGALLWWVGRRLSPTARLVATAVTLAVIVCIVLLERTGF